MSRNRKRGWVWIARNAWLVAMTLAAAVVSAQPVVNTSPVIADIPYPIVGGGETTMPSNTFVYPDAINLNLYVSDDGGVENIVWSYETVGTQIYSINGTDPIDTASEDPTDPAADGKDLNTVRKAEEDPDGKPLTITIRNVHLSPIGGPNVDPGSTEGILSNETQVVTLFASDGSTYSLTEILIYTDNEGVDRLSFDNPYYEPPPIIDDKWTMDVAAGDATLTVGSNGICIDVPAGGTNIGTWTSPYPVIEMSGNSVYRIRANMNGSQTATGHVPLWDIVVQNFDSVEGLSGANAYFTDYLFLDNEGGANAIGPAVGLDSVELYFVPLPAKCPAWNDPSTGAFTPANDARNDFQIVFRILDADQTGGYGGEFDMGQICIQTLTIDRFDLTDDVTEGETVMDLPINTTNFSAHDILGTTAFDFDTPNQVTIGPADGNFELEISRLVPGDELHRAVGTFGEIEDDYPIPWRSETIYMIEVDISAPTANDEDQPVDMIQVGMDPPTYEVFMQNTVTRGDGSMHNIGMPKSGVPQTYVSFFNSHQQSLSTEDEFKRLRPRVQVLNSTVFSFGNASWIPQTKNTGDFTVHDIRVKTVTVGS